MTATHVGMDRATKLIHTVAATEAHVADCRTMAVPQHGNETQVWRDQAYQGQGEVMRQRAPGAEDRTNRPWRTQYKRDEAVREQNRIKSKVRSRVSTSSQCWS